MVRPTLWVDGLVVQIADYSEPPQIAPNVPPEFYEAVGALIIAWGLVEHELNMLLWAVLKHNGTSEEGWKGRPFQKRYELFQAEWAKFSKGHPKLRAFPQTAYHHIQKCKPLRDSIAHKEMIMGMYGDDGSTFVQFYNKVKTKQKSKPYVVADFQNAAREARSAAGFFQWMSQPNAPWPLPSPDTRLLRSLPNTDHLRLPT